MATSSSPGGDPIRVGVIADQTGPLSFVGLANANVARMVIDDINAKGGLLGRQLELYLEDSATDDAVAEAKAAKLVEHDKVDVIFGGIYSSTRQAIKGPAVIKGKKLYIYPEQYEGQECDPLIFCTGPVPAQQVDPFIPWLMRETGAKKFYLPSADYIWPHVMNARVREVVTANGGTIVGEEYFPLDHADYRGDGRADHVERRRRGVQHDRSARRRAVPEQLHDVRLRQPRRTLVCTYFDENFLNMVPAAARRGALQLPRLLPGRRRPVQPEAARPVRRLYPGDAQVHRRQRVLRPVPRAEALGGRRDGGRLARAGRRDRGAGSRKDRRGPGRPAEMVPGQHHVRMNMYIAQARDGRFEIVKNLGAIDPKERRRRRAGRSLPERFDGRTVTAPHPTRRRTCSRNDEGRGFRPLPRDLLHQGRREAQAARSKGAPSFAIPPRTTGSGSSSTGTSRACRTSSPTPRSRRS